jgi:ribosomal protein L32
MPVEADEVEERLRALENRLRILDAQPALSADPKLQRQRRRVASQRDALREAQTFITVTLPALATCSACGKACHPTEASAEVHLKAAEVIKTGTRPSGRISVARAGARVGEMRTYRCLRSPAEAWHVGHVVRPPK